MGALPLSKRLLLLSLMAILIVFGSAANAAPAAPDLILSKKLTANKWNMMSGGKSYGTIQFSVDGHCAKAGADGVLRTKGTWKLAGTHLTLSFPEEGEPFTGTLRADGKNLVVSFEDGTIAYTYTPAR